MEYKVVNPVPDNLPLYGKVGTFVRYSVYECPVLLIDGKEYCFWPQEVEKVK